MSLFDDLRKIGAELDPSLQLGSNEVVPVLSALLHLHDHGDDLKAAADEGPAAVSKLLSPAPEPEDAPAQEGGASSDEVAELRAQVQSLLAERATAQQTQVEHETGNGETEAQQ